MTDNTDNTDDTKHEETKHEETKHEDGCVMMPSHFGRCRNQQQRDREQRYATAIAAGMHDSWAVNANTFINHPVENVLQLVAAEHEALINERDAATARLEAAEAYTWDATLDDVKAQRREEALKTQLDTLKAALERLIEAIRQHPHVLGHGLDVYFTQAITDARAALEVKP